MPWFAPYDAIFDLIAKDAPPHTKFCTNSYAVGGPLKTLS